MQDNVHDFNHSPGPADDSTTFKQPQQGQTLFWLYSRQQKLERSKSFLAEIMR